MHDAKARRQVQDFFGLLIKIGTVVGFGYLGFGRFAFRRQVPPFPARPASDRRIELREVDLAVGICPQRRFIRVPHLRRVSDSWEGFRDKFPGSGMRFFVDGHIGEAEQARTLDLGGKRRSAAVDQDRQGVEIGGLDDKLPQDAAPGIKPFPAYRVA
jgi:hypothetical protein